jgi:hypothetical protein
MLLNFGLRITFFGFLDSMSAIASSYAWCRADSAFAMKSGVLHRKRISHITPVQVAGHTSVIVGTFHLNASGLASILKLTTNGVGSVTEPGGAN